MLTINKIGYSAASVNIQNNRTVTVYENKPRLKTLERDTVSFNGRFGDLFKKLITPKPKCVSQEVYDSVCKFIEDNPNTHAGMFLKQIKLLSENFSSVTEMSASCHAKHVEKEKIEEVSQLLMQVKNCKETEREPVIRQLIDDYNEILRKKSNN